MSDIYEKMREYKRGILDAAIVFELTGLLQKIIKIKPKSVVIDDKYGHEELRNVIASLLEHSKTRHIPITLIKNANVEDIVDLGVDDFVLKNDLSAGELFASIHHSVKFRATRNYLRKVSAKQSGLMRTLDRLTKFRSAASF
jgi:DNA-binding NarL/FixJ family response regulator